jgi:hypothetical protein
MVVRMREGVETKYPGSYRCIVQLGLGELPMKPSPCVLACELPFAQTYDSFPFFPFFLLHVVCILMSL